MKKLISIITPVFNEEEVIRDYYKKISATIDSLSQQYDFEIIITDNCSTDKTAEIIFELAKKDHRIFYYKFSRNFGYQKSIWTGYSKCKGDAAIEFDADLQDPPEMLPEMLKYWENGHKIVYGIRKNRKEGKFITLCRKIYYRLVRIMSDETDIPNDAGDFMLLDRKIINHLSNMKLYSPYLRGMIFSFGYSKKGLEYSRNERMAGTSKFPFIKMLKLAIDGIVSTSNFPLKIGSFVGFASAFAAFLLAFYFIIDKLILGDALPRGITAILVLLLASIAINSVLIGIMGEYIGRIYKQITMQNQVTIIEKEINFTDKNSK